MTQSPIDTLGQQLQEAVRRRRRRRRIGRGGLALVAAVVVGGGVAAASQLIGSGERSAADRAIFAGQRAALTDRLCATVRRGGPPRMVSDPLPADVTRQLGVFRRARAPRDRVPTRDLHLVGTRVLTRGVRVAHASDGARFAMFISYGAPNFPHGPADEAGCLRATLRAALAQPEAKDPGVRAEITASLQRQIGRVESLIHGTAHYLTIDTIDSKGRLMGGGATILHDGKIPAFAGIGLGRRGDRRFVEVMGLITDGIDSVRIIDSSGPAARRVSPRIIKIRDNVYHARLPRRMGPRISVQWRAGDGRIVRTTHLSF